MTAVEYVRLGDVVLRATRSEAVTSGKEFPMLGVRSFGRGAFNAGELAGMDTSYPKLNMAIENDVVYPKLMAWEGAFAIVDDSLSGRFVSPEFCTFEIDERVLHPAYLKQLMQTDPFMLSVRSAAIGTNVRRRRLQPSAFEEIKIPLPPLDEQRRIALAVGQAATPGEGIARASTVSPSLTAAILRDCFLPTWPRVPIEKLVTQRSDYVPVESTKYYVSLGLRKRVAGAFLRPPKSGGEIKAFKLQHLRPGDFIYSRLFAWQGSFGLVPDGGSSTYASSEFPAFSVNEELVNAKYLLAWFRQPEVWRIVEALCTGSTPGSRNRLKEKQFEGLKIPLPPLNEQLTVVERMRGLTAYNDLEVQRQKLSEALPKAVRNEIFSKLIK